MPLPKINRYKIEVMKQNSETPERIFFCFGYSESDARAALKEIASSINFFDNLNETTAVHYRITEDEENILQPK